MDKRVVITGLGGLCGLGTDASSIWTEMREGRSAIGPISNSEIHELKGMIRTEIKCCLNTTLIANSSSPWTASACLPCLQLKTATAGRTFLR
ncbi:beta-ketoacyl synthase N-terminal-like domain-containing protein [Rhizobium beringeri]